MEVREGVEAQCHRGHDDEGDAEGCHYLKTKQKGTKRNKETEQNKTIQN